MTKIDRIQGITEHPNSHLPTHRTELTRLNMFFAEKLTPSMHSRVNYRDLQNTFHDYYFYSEVCYPSFSYNRVTRELLKTFPDAYVASIKGVRYFCNIDFKK